jgi:phenylacetate-CoA ligase
MFLYARSLYAHGVRAGWRAFFGFSYPPFIGFWLAHYAAEMMGCQVVPKGPLPTEAWLRLMQRLAPGSRRGLQCATPTFAQRQLDVAQTAGIDPAELGISVLSLAGEPGACVPSTKRALENRWGAGVHDIMGSTETSGPLLFTCAAQAALAEPSPHVNVDYFVTEVLDPQTREPVGDGRPGVLCVTALSRFGMPAVRFLLNDYVTLSWEACDCGRSLPLARGGISARADDVVIVNGVNLYPALVQDVVHGIPELTSEYALVRRGRSAAVVVEARAASDASEVLADRVRTALAHATTLTLDVEVVAAGTLPRGEMKSRRVRA